MDHASAGEIRINSGLDGAIYRSATCVPALRLQKFLPVGVANITSQADKGTPWRRASGPWSIILELENSSACLKRR